MTTTPANHPVSPLLSHSVFCFRTVKAAKTKVPGLLQSKAGQPADQELGLKEQVEVGAGVTHQVWMLL